MTTHKDNMPDEIDISEIKEQARYSLDRIRQVYKHHFGEIQNGSPLDGWIKNIRLSLKYIRADLSREKELLAVIRDLDAALNAAFGGGELYLQITHEHAAIISEANMDGVEE